MMESGRCILSPVAWTDLDEVVALYGDERVRRFLGGTVGDEAVRARFAALVSPEPPACHWVARRKEGGTFVGLLSLGPHHDGAGIELSYQVVPGQWGMGVASEVVAALIRHALGAMGLPYLLAETQRANGTSCRLLERLGFRLERTVERFGASQAIYRTTRLPDA